MATTKDRTHRTRERHTAPDPEARSDSSRMRRPLERRAESHQTDARRAVRQERRGAAVRRDVPAAQMPAPTAPKQKSKTPWRDFIRTFTLEKAFTLSGFIVAGVLVIPFGLDLMTGWPLHRASIPYEATSVACGLCLAYLSWDVLRDQLRGRIR